MKSEKEALEACDHPNIVRLHAAFTDDQHVYLLMELALGGELFTLLNQMGVLEEDAVR